MAINIPIITEFSDAGIKSAEAGFKNLKMKVAEAEGGMGKLKAGFGAATDYMKANAASFATAAGGALVAFAAKGVSAFQDLALESGKFADATGLAVDQASRWIEVAGDIGVEAGSVQTSINKLNKTIGATPKLFEELGIQIAKTDDGATDVNKTFLNVIDKLKAIKDPAERATVASQLLGKSWTDLSELIQMGSGDLNRALNSVSGAKVINEKELQKAKDFRAAQDALKDSLDDLALSIGQSLIPTLTTLAESLSGTFGFVEKGASAFSWWEKIQPWHFFEYLTASSDDSTDAVSHFNDALGANRNALEEARWAARDLQAGLGLLDNDLNGVIDTWDRMTAKMLDKQTWENIKKEFEQLMIEGEKAFGGNEESAAKFQDGLVALTGDVGDYIGRLGDIPLDIQSQLQLLWDRGEFQAVINYLDKYRQGVIIPVWAARRTAITPSGEGSGRTTYQPPRSSGSGGSSSAPPPPPAPPHDSGFSFLNPGSTIGVPGATVNSVTVNVAGSVMSERDLVETVRRGLVDSQKSGNQLIYNGS